MAIGIIDNDGNMSVLKGVSPDQLKSKQNMRFRVYDRIDNMFYYPGAAGTRFKIDSCGNLITPSGQVSDPNQIIQFSSGVFDKNGVEIYDGDIVEYSIGQISNRDLVSYDSENLMWILSGTGENIGKAFQLVRYLDYTVIRQEV